MYILKVNNRETNEELNYELNTTYKTIDRIQARTNKSIEYHFRGVVDTFIREKVELLADGLYDQKQRNDFVNTVLNNLAPIKINLYCQYFLVELLSDGLTEEEKNEYFQKNQLDQLIK